MVLNNAPVSARIGGQGDVIECERQEIATRAGYVQGTCRDGSWLSCNCQAKDSR